MSMVAEGTISMADEMNMPTTNIGSRSLIGRKGLTKVPKKIHKAEREKLKRDQLNELFQELDQVLETTRQNNGKASILIDAARILQDLLAQVDCLKKENAALLTESHYVTVEKNELKEEKTLIGSEIEKLQKELQVRMLSSPGWSNGAGTIRSQHTKLPSSLPEDRPLQLPTVDLTMQAPSVEPAFVFQFRPQVQIYEEPNSVRLPSKPTLQVMRPHARYPTPSDAWPSKILASRTTQKTLPRHSASSNTTSNAEVGSGGC